MYNSYRSNFGDVGKKRKPVCCLRELSRNTGTPYSTIYNRMKKTESPLEVVFQSKATKYYDLEELNNWHKSYD